MSEENKRKFEEAPKTTLLSAMKVLKSGKLLLRKKNPFLPILLTGRHGGAGVSTVTSQQEVFLIRTRSSVWSLHVLPVSAGFAPGAPVSPHIQRHAD